MPMYTIETPEKFPTILGVPCQLMHSCISGTVTMDDGGGEGGD